MFVFKNSVSILLICVAIVTLCTSLKKNRWNGYPQWYYTQNPGRPAYPYYPMPMYSSPYAAPYLASYAPPYAPSYSAPYAVPHSAHQFWPMQSNAIIPPYWPSFMPAWPSWPMPNYSPMPSASLPHYPAPRSPVLVQKPARGRRPVLAEIRIPTAIKVRAPVRAPVRVPTAAPPLVHVHVPVILEVRKPRRQSALKRAAHLLGFRHHKKHKKPQVVVLQPVQTVPGYTPRLTPVQLSHTSRLNPTFRSVPPQLPPAYPSRLASSLGAPSAYYSPSHTLLPQQHQSGQYTYQPNNHLNPNQTRG